MERTGPWSGQSGQEVDSGDKARHLPNARALGGHLPPRVSTPPPPLPCGKEGGEAAPLGSALSQPRRLWTLPPLSPPSQTLPGRVPRPAFRWVFPCLLSHFLPLHSHFPFSAYFFLPLAFLPSFAVSSFPPSLFSINNTQTLLDGTPAPANGPFGRREWVRKKNIWGERECGI